MVEVQIISKETIKPSSPTPENLRYLQLSFIDQLMPTSHTPIILFYSPQQTTHKSTLLKKSLSDVLTRFYPFAGRLKHDDHAPGSDYSYVHCNDEGVVFYEARVHAELSQFLKPNNQTVLLLPAIESPTIPLYLQFNVFDCGGSAIVVYLSHKIGDGSSLTAFINGWADANRTQKLGVSPTFGFASLFPPGNMTKKQSLPNMNENLSQMRLLFEPSKMVLLKEKVHTVTGLLPTRVEAVTALIWRCALRARGEEKLHRKPIATHPVDIRGRMEPPLPEYSIGNFALVAFAIGERVADDRGGDRVGYLEGRLREAMGKVKGDYVKELIENDGVMVLDGSWVNFFEESWYKHWEELGCDCMMFTSWCKFPFFESDFGWGKPESLGLPDIPMQDLVTLLPTRDGGIEARVCLIHDEMAKFEQDPELLAFVYHNCV